MATYYVSTHSDRVFVIEADGFSIDRDSRTYSFFKNPVEPSTVLSLVGSVPIDGVFAVAEKEAFQADFYEDDEDDEDEKQEFLESEEFWDAVWNVIDAWHSDPDDGPVEPEYNHPEAAE